MKRIRITTPDVVIWLLYSGWELDDPERLKPREGHEEAFHAEPEKLEMWNAIFGDLSLIHI